MVLVYEVFVIKQSIKDALIDETVPGGYFPGFNVYTEDALPLRMMIPCLVVFTPTTTLIGRHVGGGRIYQLSARVEVHITDKYRATDSGHDYRRDDAMKIVVDNTERLLEGLTFPSTITVVGIPTCRTIDNVTGASNFQVYMSTVTFFMDFLKV